MVSVDQVGADVGTHVVHGGKGAQHRVSVDQVGADVGTTTRRSRRRWPPGVRRSGWCRRRHPQNIQRVYELESECPSIRLVPTSAPGVTGEKRKLLLACPSIRLVPTSAPELFPPCRRIYAVSVDQVGADVGTGPRRLHLPPAVSVRRSGWCRRRHPNGRTCATWTPRCPSIRLVPTSAPHGNPALPTTIM